MEHREALLALRTFLSTQILGQEKLIERLLIALLADGHMLVEGAPGLAKTKAIKELAEGVEAQFHRIQFTPDLLPADITGTEIYRPETGSFVFQQGPIFHQPGAGGRNQPRPSQGPVGLARSHGRAPGRRRAQHL